MASDLIRSTYRSVWWAFMLRGLFAIALGLVILWRPIESIAAFALVIAIWALFTGFIEIIHAFQLRTAFRQWWVMLLSGLISVGFGTAAFNYYPLLSLTFAVIWATWWLFLSGALALSAAMMERKMGVGWGRTLAFGVVAFVTGVVALMNPPATLAAIMGLIAGFALVSGIVLIIGAFKLSSLKSKLSQAVGAAS